MKMAPQKVYEAVVQGPLGWPLLRPETQVIQRPGWYQVVTPTSITTGNNEVIVSEIEPDLVDSTIKKVSDQYRANGSAFKWCVGPWTKPTDMGERLARLASSSWSARGMACEPGELRLAPVPGCRVEEVTQANVADWLDATAAGWNLAPSDVAVSRWQISH